MAETTPDNIVKPPKIRQGIPTAYGVVIMLVVAVAVGAMFYFLNSAPDIGTIPDVTFNHDKKLTAECEAGENCLGPSLKAEDPEGDKLTYKFYDKATGELIKEITANSGEEVTPDFKFDSAGQKNLYMVVEDGSGHTSKDYPIIIPVK